MSTPNGAEVDDPPLIVVINKVTYKLKSLEDAARCKYLADTVGIKLGLKTIAGGNCLADHVKWLAFNSLTGVELKEAVELLIYAGILVLEKNNTKEIIWSDGESAMPRFLGLKTYFRGHDQPSSRASSFLYCAAMSRADAHRVYRVRFWFDEFRYEDRAGG